VIHRFRSSLCPTQSCDGVTQTDASEGICPREGRGEGPISQDEARVPAKVAPQQDDMDSFFGSAPTPAKVCLRLSPSAPVDFFLRFNFEAEW